MVHTKNTSGVEIDEGDYENQSYGAVACVTTSGTSLGVDNLTIDGSTGLPGPVDEWCADRVLNMSQRNVTSIRDVSKIDNAYVYSPKVYSITLTDDTATNNTGTSVLDVGESFVGSITLSANSKTDPQAILTFRSADSGSNVQIMSSLNADKLEVADDLVLAGTTGTDGKLTVSTSDSHPGLIYIENRLGSQVTVNLLVSN
jgi:hypothetical protein